MVRLWERTEAHAGRAGLEPPFWGFAWAGGIGLARYLLDHPDAVRNRRVLDLGTGCGVVAVAAAKAGAAAVTACDVDPLAVVAATVNAEANGVAVDVLLADLVADLVTDAGVTAGVVAGVEVVLAGDVCYDRDVTTRLARYLRAVADGGATVLLGDPGRRYLPRTGLVELAGYDIDVPRDLEGTDSRRVTVWSMPGRARGA